MSQQQTFTTISPGEDCLFWAGAATAPKVLTLIEWDDNMAVTSQGRCPASYIYVLSFKAEAERLRGQYLTVLAEIERYKSINRGARP